MAGIELAEMVQELRDELAKALCAGAGEEIRFELQEVTLEARVEVTRETTGKAGVKFWVFTGAEASAGVESARGHTVTLKLRPHRSDGVNLDLARE